jgi:hypothetical protein
MFIKLLNDHLNGLIKIAGNENFFFQKGKVQGRWVDLLVGSFVERFHQLKMTNMNMQEIQQIQ